jgi:hypothetical protein
MTTDRQPTDDEKAGMNWWNGLTEVQRAEWLLIADTAVPVVAWAVYQQRCRVASPNSITGCLTKNVTGGSA